MLNRMMGTILIVVAVCSAVWAQGRIQSNPLSSDEDIRQNAGAGVARTNPAAADAHALKLIGAAASSEDINIGPNDLNAIEVHNAVTTVSVDVPADPARTYLYLCTSSFAFWQQVPSASPLLFRGLISVRFDTVGGTFFDVFSIDGIREFEVSSKKVNHMPVPAGCGAVDETQLTVFFQSGGLSEADALALSRRVLRGDSHLTVVFLARMRSVSDFEVTDPALQVWSD